MHALRATLALVLAAALSVPAAPLAGERSQVPEKYRWNLADLYPSEAAWAKASESIRKRIPGLAAHRGHLGDLAEALWRALDAMYAIDRDLSRLSVYASALSDEDTREARPREMKQAAEQLAVDFGAAASFVRPEILALDPARVRAFIAKEPRLGEYRFYLEDVLRWKPHTLSSPEERIVAEAGNLTDAGQSVYGVLKDADFPYPRIKLSTGEEVRLDSSAFALHRASPVREDRDRVFAAFFGALGGFEATFGSTFYAQVRAHLFVKKVRGFGSALESALFRDAIPTSVYRQLVADVHRSLPTLHRYLELRRRMMGLDQLRYQDLYAPLVERVKMAFTPEEARAITLDAFAPLGKDYVAALAKAYQSRWTDFLPSTGKKPGAYSESAAYDVHPYQLLNFNGQYDDLSTLAHESGHSMHGWLANGSQPYATHQSPIFTAEVASTLNENLLFHFMLERAKDDQTRLALLGNHLETLRTTLFRQTLFAEFELGAHETAERGETLTGQNLSALYLKLVRQYYGHDQGRCRVDDVVGKEWEFIPHFYYDFYVYQYATSLVASTSLAQGVRDEMGKRTARRDAYLAMLKAGGSRYPIDLLKDAGVDMTTSAPFQAAIADMNATMDQMEKILARQKAAR